MSGPKKKEPVDDGQFIWIEYPLLQWEGLLDCKRGIRDVDRPNTDQTPLSSFGGHSAMMRLFVYYTYWSASGETQIRVVDREREEALLLELGPRGAR